MTPADIALSARSLSNQDLTLPTALWTGAAVLNRIHKIWQGSLYVENLPGFLSGAFYKTFISGDNPFMTWPTVPFFITARFLDLFEQEDEWNRSSVRWLDALKCVQPIYYKIEASEQPRLFFVSKPSIAWLKIHSYCFVIRIQRIVMKSLDLLWNSFKLIMRVMDVVELVTMDLSTLPNRSALESGMHVPRCLALLENQENKEAFYERLKNKQSGMRAVGEFYNSDKLKVADCVKQLFNLIEQGIFVYKKGTGLWSEAIFFLIKQGVYDWSPDYIKGYLEEPNSKEFLKKVQGDAEEVKSAPLDVISYTPTHEKIEPLPIPYKKSVKVFTPQAKSLRNFYALNGKKTAVMPLPQWTFTL